jgi:tRNA(Arg) A34 adenosine deaminase TadA
MNDHERFMAMAIMEAKLGAAAGEQPFGAVVARGDEVICEARIQPTQRNDALLARPGGLQECRSFTPKGKIT